jgi:hypothetical protein
MTSLLPELPFLGQKLGGIPWILRLKWWDGAGEGIRTLDVLLGKLAGGRLDSGGEKWRHWKYWKGF